MISWTDLLNAENLQSNSQRYSAYKEGPVVVWNTTSRCNLECQHCYFDARKAHDHRELNHQEAKDFIADLSLLKVAVLLFSGGEPLLREDIFKLAKFAQERGIKTALSTNGTLITPKVATGIKAAGFSYVGISLDGTRETNDWFRKKSGAFIKTLTGIRNCQKIGLKVGLRLTLSKYNFQDLGSIFELVEKENIQRFCLYHLVYSGRGSNLKQKDLSAREKREALEFIWQKTLDFQQRNLKTEILTVDNHADGVWIYLRLKRHNPSRAKKVLRLLKAQGGNSSGVKIACVDNRGGIYPDQFWRAHPLGNIRMKKFSQVWQDKDNRVLQALRNRQDLLKGRCQRCCYLSICNGNLRARAEAVFADPWQEDPACYLTEEEISKR